MKTLRNSLILLLICAALSAQDITSQQLYKENTLLPNPLLIEGKVGFFIPLNQKFRDIYSQVECIWGGEATYRVTDSFYAWGSASYVSDKGYSRGFKHSTHVSLLPLALGVKYFLPTDCGNYYIGAGLQYTRFHTKDDSPYVIHKITRWNWGALAKAGTLIPLCDCVYLDLFAEYSYLQMHFRKTHHGAVYRHKADLSSINFGIGLSYLL